MRPGSSGRRRGCWLVVAAVSGGAAGVVPGGGVTGEHYNPELVGVGLFASKWLCSFPAAARQVQLTARHALLLLLPYKQCRGRHSRSARVLESARAERLQARAGFLLDRVHVSRRLACRGQPVLQKPC